MQELKKKEWVLDTTGFLETDDKIDKKYLSNVRKEIEMLDENEARQLLASFDANPAPPSTTNVLLRHREKPMMRVRESRTVQLVKVVGNDSK